MRMFPHILLAIPFFVLAQSLGLIDTYPAMILALVAINQPFTIWLMRSFFVDVPLELYEAAAIDGCNAWQVFARVALPVVRPGLWVTALFSLLLAYNEFLFALVLTGPDTKTLPVAIAEYGGEDINYWSLSAAAAVGIMLPIVAVHDGAAAAIWCAGWHSARSRASPRRCRTAARSRTDANLRLRHTAGWCGAVGTRWRSHALGMAQSGHPGGMAACRVAWRALSDAAP